MLKTADREPLRIQITRDVLESAKDVGATPVIAACRRILIAYRLGRRADRADLRLVREIAEAARDPRCCF